MLANHTVKAHGITGDMIREAAGLCHDARICSPEFTEEHRERTADNSVRLENLRIGWGQAPQSSEKVGRMTGARMRAYRRLAQMHPDEFRRLYAEEAALTSPQGVRMTKTDEKAADRVLCRAVKRTRRLLKEGAEIRDVTPVLEVAIIAAALLMEEPAA